MREKYRLRIAIVAALKKKGREGGWWRLKVEK